MIFFTTSTLFLVGQVNYLNTRLPHLLLSFAAFENSFLADFEQFYFYRNRQFKRLQVLAQPQHAMRLEPNPKVQYYNS